MSSTKKDKVKSKIIHRRPLEGGKQTWKPKPVVNSEGIPPHFFTVEQMIKRCQKVGIHKTYATYLIWIRKYELGHKSTNRWYIDPMKLERFLHGTD